MTLVLSGVADYLTKQDGVRSVPLPEGDDVIAYLLEQADRDLQTFINCHLVAAQFTMQLDACQQDDNLTFVMDSYTDNATCCENSTEGVGVSSASPINNVHVLTNGSDSYSDSNSSSDLENATLDDDSCADNESADVLSLTANGLYNYETLHSVPLALNAISNALFR